MKDTLDAMQLPRDFHATANKITDILVRECGSDMRGATAVIGAIIVGIFVRHRFEHDQQGRLRVFDVYTRTIRDMLVDTVEAGLAIEDDGITSH